MKKIRLYSMIFLLAALCLLLPLRSEAANKMWWSTCLTGGTAGCLDSLDGDDLTDGDAAFVVRDNSGTYEIYFYRLEDTAGASESSPTTILPDTNPGNKSWKLAKILGSALTINGAVSFQKSDATPIMTMCTEPPGSNSFPVISPGGSCGWMATSDVTATTGYVTIESASSGQLACWHTDELSLTSCGAPMTDESTASHAIYKDSDSKIQNQVLTFVLDENADDDTTVSLIPGICPIITNAGQGAANVSNALPAVGAAKCFVALATTAQAGNYWRLTAAAVNTICLNRTCGKDYIQFDTPAVGDTFTCMSDGTNWYCYDRDSDATAGDL